MVKLLQELLIENLALLERLRIELQGGLTVISGETGAGKSILVDAVGLLLGDRASTDLIREGAERAVVEGYFTECAGGAVAEALEEMELQAEENGGLWLCREISRGGKSVCRVNGRAVTLAVLQEVGRHLVDIHGQHEHQSLLLPARQLALLDSFGGQEVAALRVSLEKTYRAWKETEKGLASARGEEQERNRRRDLLAFQVREIEEARLRPGEEEELLERRQVLAGAERLAEGTARAYDLLWGGAGGVQAAGDLLGAALGLLKELKGIDRHLLSLEEPLETAYYQVEDAARELRRYADKVQNSPELLTGVEERLETLRQLKRKFGESVGEILEYHRQAAATLAEMAAGEELTRELEEGLPALEGEYYRLAGELSRRRREAAGNLAGKVNFLLAGLGMPGARFEVQLRPTEPGPHGVEGVEFAFSANPGEPLKPLARVISGGELSRLMLALQSILAELGGLPTLVFDEVDAGVGGRSAQSVAELLVSVSCSRQVLSITHLAQIACRADSHFRIEKEVSGGRTFARLKKLEQEELVEELARMLDGGLSRSSREHAREMLIIAKKQAK